MRKDVFEAAAEGKMKLPLSHFTNLVHFVHENGPLIRILADFIDRRQHLFIVVDEYGTMQVSFQWKMYWKRSLEEKLSMKLIKKKTFGSWRYNR